MSRHIEPNASHFSARYAERKRAAERARDAEVRPNPCNRCSAERAQESIFCALHAEQAKVLQRAAVSGLVLGDRKAWDEYEAFCQRTYWP